jgi:alkylation response protein AidB-like acyl-CoA dehydrogenase
VTSSAPTAPADPLLALAAYASAFERWLAQAPAALAAARRPIPAYASRVGAMSGLMAALHEAGWSRYGWPEALGGRGGSVLHRAAMWSALARSGLPGMAVFEHLEILAPVLVAMARAPFVAEVLPRYLSGRELWCQGFSEPDAGSDLASIRTRAVRTGDGYSVTGRKIWTSWARYATWCLVLARTGTPESRHRGVTALAVDLRSPGITVRAIEQANGTDELAEVTFDDVFVPAERMVGEPERGWDVAMYILAHERGTFAWFRHSFLYSRLLEQLPYALERCDQALGDALLDLTAVSATSQGALRTHEAGSTLGPRAAMTKLLLCESERSVHDWMLACDGDLAAGVHDEATAVLRQDYLFSRIVTVYGGSQQMQLETVAKRVLDLP